jgi:hypothetical protein
VLRSRCLLVLKAFHHKLRDNVPLRNLLEEDTRAVAAGPAAAGRELPATD